jgi:hypothetical protein
VVVPLPFSTQPADAGGDSARTSVGGGAGKASSAGMQVQGDQDNVVPVTVEDDYVQVRLSTAGSVLK